MMNCHRSILLVVWLWLGAGNLLLAQPTNGVRSVEQLRALLNTELAQPRFSAATWGVKVVSLDTGRTLFEHDADRLMSPASNTKLYTAALALDRLGGDYRLPTAVYATSPVTPDGVLRGDLVVVGHGDPSWNERRLGTNFWADFEPLVGIIQGAGVRRVDGQVIGDATFFRGPPTGSSWTVDDLSSGEAGLISALSLDDNLVRVRVESSAQSGAGCACVLLQPGSGLVFSNQVITVTPDLSAHLDYYRPADGNLVYLRGQLPMGGAGETINVTVPRPAEWFANGLKLALARRGIPVAGPARGVMWPEAGPNVSGGGAGVKLGTVYSAPVREVVRDLLKTSQNLETDLLLAHVGELTRVTNAPPWQTSEQAGVRELTRFLEQAGVAPGAVAFDEGSGLSRNNLTTAEATVALLQFMARHREHAAFLAALPVAGVDGTLSQRFRGTVAAGHVRAKTGTLRWAQALSGYVTTAAGEHLAFSFMLNRYTATARHSGQDEIDAQVVRLAGLAGRSDAPR